jgi:uncharacterized membrane-anchored protein YhcB (DUF1043 family)
MRNFEKHRRKITKLLDQITQAYPNIYAFLEDKGVSSSIADEAQEFMTHEINTRLQKAIEAAQDKLIGQLQLLDDVLDQHRDEVADLIRKVENI